MAGTNPTPAADVAELQQGEFYVSFNVMHVCYLFPFSGKQYFTGCDHTPLTIYYNLSLFFFRLGLNLNVNLF